MPIAERIPSSNVRCLEGLHIILHIPHILLRALAIGPISAIFPLAEMGNNDFSFFSKTNVSDAMLRAIERCSVV